MMQILKQNLSREYAQEKFWEAKNLLKPEPERMEAFRNTVHWLQITVKLFSGDF